MDEKKVVGPGIPSPGRLLSIQREEYGWSTRDVARALRLSERQIVAIEQDDYGVLPGKTYVMGYWKSYAQLLKLPIDESIQVHRANLPTPVKETAFEPDHKQIRGNEESSRKRAALLFAILLAAFLGAIWYWQNPNASFSQWIDIGMDKFSERSQTGNDTSIADEEKLQQVDELELPETELVQPESVLALPVPNFSEGQESVAINTRGYEVLVAELPLSGSKLIYLEAVEVESDSATIADDSAGVVAVEISPQTAVSSSEPVAVNQNPVDPVVETQSQTQPEPKPKPKPPPQPQQTAQSVEQPRVAQAVGSTSADNTISFKVEKESWVDVRDSSGERLIYRTVNRGEDIQLAGIPPYSVFIGSAEGVVVQYQGKDVPFKVHESGLFARFEVGSQ